MRTITTNDLATIWPEAVVIDVRSAEEYATAHIPGSRNIPLNHLTSRLKDVPGTTVHVLCGSGMRSSQAVAILTGHGHDAVNIAGGITEWYRNGHPVTYAPPVTEHPKPADRRPLAAALTWIFKRTNR